MKTRTTIHWLAGLAGALLLAVPALGWAQSPWGKGGVPAVLEQCEDELAACLAEPCAIFPGDGWPDDPPDYALPGGAPLSYTDNGDGTFTDDNTGLMWEVKTGIVGDPVACVHGSFPPSCWADVANVNNRWTWTEADDDPTDPDGTAFVFFLEMRNHTCGGQMFEVECDSDADCAGETHPYCGLGGHMDWRLPTAKELQSLVDYSVPYPGPVVKQDPEGLPGATAPSYYWSSTADASNDGNAWNVHFAGGHVGSGYVGYNLKGNDFHVRAVRGGW
jgi:hypothetical protein